MLTGLLWTVLLNGGLGIGAYLVARHGFRQPAGPSRTLAAAVLGWAWLTVGMQFLGGLGWLTRGPLLGWVAGGNILGLICRVWRGKGREERVLSASTGRDVWSSAEVAAVGLLLWASAILAGPSLLRAVKVVSDGPIYHLYFAARWWKAGRLVMVAAPFGENAATYFPAGGDLWFAWLMVGWGGDLLAKVGQAPFFGLCGLTTVALARRLGAGRPAAVVAAAWFLASPPFLLYAFEPNVDAVFVAGYLLAAYFLLRHALGDDGAAALALGGLAAGLALGTKAPAVVFVPPLVVLGMTSAVRKGRSAAEKGLGAVAVGLTPLTVAGFWYARDAALTGNPLYPLHVEAFGRVWLSGWYGPGAMRLSPYYLPVHSWRAFLDILLGVLDPRLAPVWVAALAGLWRLKAVPRGDADRAVWAATALAVLNVALYWLVIPYRTQQRFFLQALGLAALPLARLFGRARWAPAAGAALLAVHVLTPQSWPFALQDPPWDFTPLIPNRMPALISLPVQPAALGVTAGLGAAAMATAWSWSRSTSSRRAAGMAVGVTAGFAAGALAVSYPWGSDARQRFYPNFPEYVRGWLEFDLRAGPQGSRVAYAGTDLPYYLLGPGLRNEVRYVNTDAHPGWLPHDYHRDAVESGRGPRTWDNPRPGWDRVRRDYGAWLANLRAEGIQLLVVTRANPAEGPHNVADRQGFPVERGWADAHPEVFEPLYGAAEGDPQFRLYRLKSP